VFAPTCQVQRFEQDVRLLLKLKHPNIVQFIDAAIEGERPYLAMELIDGGSLATRLASGTAFTPAGSAHLIRKLAEAVQYAHDQHVIHRDIKPGNVLLDATVEPQLIDFGLARDLTVAAVTRSGEMLGTPLYMAPEQPRRSLTPQRSSNHFAGFAATEPLRADHDVNATSTHLSWRHSRSSPINR